ncbi:putative glycerophosphodiester phosphodiesterase, protein kinase RLK-Pelle-LRK10L-2 family [Helianthus annuus]|nr:putative glycerophosphodiester phosphodiesterase, protein kinase RLK-Pelle-LRK10L-2 family [Helianthus annuus]KAJ0447638.1 putative glycerophosphodiester phosphodiesterase, protein kinase RLK-Pelle-LRK10L-2 family [Helianthus annuus]KAJ0632541.1 putative glycerophosphodiester phosphodiesterase, protein kinase RLK-Pelle-LRK10L-2 family [Helianthus annuus]KAJ0826431.1 putative glycerophosphodiester phosphodiesterase, protein kinase RLK-Pelle-LRK10L-2 family [Helianthus annuus]
MENFTSPSPLLYSFSTDPFITLFKCPNKLGYAQQVHTYFNQRNYNSYNGCEGYNFYYKYLVSNATVPKDLPSTCQVIQLPVKQRWQFYPQQPDEINISSLLSSAFTISFQMSASCEDCHRRFGQCDTNNGYFQCIHAVEGNRTIKLILELSVGIATFSAGVVTISIIILCLKRNLRRKKKVKYNVNAENFLKTNKFFAPKRYSYSQVQKITNSFEVKLGQGGFGTVYKGSLSNGNFVAVKVLSESKGNGEDFINEVASVGRTSHVNIVNLVGFCLEDRRRALIYEFMPNGSLEKFIYGRSSSSISQLGWEKLHGIARGLEYLHRGCDTRILHFDIKPHNILLDQDFCPKISDFGLAKLFLEKRSMISMSCVRGTPGYIAPEVVSRNFGHVSHKSDVYSYGMMILEMVGGRRNVETEVDHTSEIYFPHWIYKKVVVEEEQLGLHGIVSEEENEMARKMIIVGLWCIQTNPLNRPAITKVLEMLEGGLDLLEIPPKPYMYSP